MIGRVLPDAEEGVMHLPGGVRWFMLLVAAPTLMGSAAADTADLAAPAPVGPDDVVVIAVIDDGFLPYHWDYLASRMPQHLDNDPTNDLPLTEPPHTWLPGFPDPSAFDSYQPMPITLDGANPTTSIATLSAPDMPRWASLRVSNRNDHHFYWLPGTKVIGMLQWRTGSPIGQGNAHPHGSYTASVSTGTIHGTCPECLLVFLPAVGGDGEAAIDWAMSQPWIDAISNSYGFSLVVRDRLYSGSDVSLQRTATQRGQSIFFSAGNGQDGSFAVPNSTLFSSQEGPDWITTVGAVSDRGTEYSGSGKPADIAGLGSAYPSLGGTTVSGTGSFGGTSNATPQIAGLYGRALSRARLLLDGPSRLQDAGVIASGAPIACGEAFAGCDLGDGVLTVDELRMRLFHGAVRTERGMGVAGTGPIAGTAETTLANQGHGTYFARAAEPEVQAEELARLLGPLDGTVAPVARAAEEGDWFVVDSWCRQHLWGAWEAGYWHDGDPLPADDPAWPLRTLLARECDSLFPPF